jgi:hypothetical protein
MAPACPSIHTTGFPKIVEVTIGVPEIVTPVLAIVRVLVTKTFGVPEIVTAVAARVRVLVTKAFTAGTMTPAGMDPKVVTAVAPRATPAT